MSDITRVGSVVPRVPLRRADDLVERIAALKADADARGFGTLAYFLEVAGREAEIEADRIAEERKTGKRASYESWRPVTDRD